MPNNTDNKDGSPNAQAQRSPGLLNPLDPTRLTIAGSPRPTPAEYAAMRKGTSQGWATFLGRTSATRPDLHGIRVTGSRSESGRIRIVLDELGNCPPLPEIPKADGADR